MIGMVVRRRPAMDRNVVADLLRERLRTILDRRPTWAGLIKPVTVSFPAAYSTGTVDFAVGSNIVVGTDTAWPVSDQVNVTITEQIPGPGQYLVTPGPNMNGITTSTVLYVDAGGPNPEILPVQGIVGPRILLTFQYPHAAGSTATASSLSQLQFRLNGFSSPVYSILAVTSATTLVVDQICGQPITNGGYWILLMYLPIDPQIKDILTCYDPFQMLDLQLKVPQSYLNQIDPDRTATNSPIYVSPRSPQANGLMTYEVWPPVYIQYQLVFQIRFQWPEMRQQYDYPPPFINPNALIYGALADAYATPCGRPPEYKDPGFSLENSQKYEGMFAQAVLDLIEADEARDSSMFTFEAPQWSMGANWAASHDDTPWIRP